MKRLTPRIAILAALVLGIAVVSGTAIAASDGVTASPSGFLDSLAKHLGISRDKLDDAVQAAAVDQVDAALADGRITKEQADELKTRIESGAVPAFGLGHGFGHGLRGLHGGGTLTAAAEYLGLTEAELRTGLADGKTLKQITEAAGKSVDGLEKALVAAEKEKLDQAVKDGRLTEAQAKEILARYTDRVDDLVAGTLARPGLDGPHGWFGGPGMSRQSNAYGSTRPAWGAPA